MVFVEYVLTSYVENKLYIENKNKFLIINNNELKNTIDRKRQMKGKENTSINNRFFVSLFGSCLFFVSRTRVCQLIVPVITY